MFKSKKKTETKCDCGSDCNCNQESTIESEKLIKKTKLESVMESSLKGIKSMIDTSVVVGEKLELNDGTVVFPLSKVSVGFVTGGGEYGEGESEAKKYPFTGGSGAGFTVNPVGFAVLKNGEIKLLKVEPSELLEKVIDKVPDIIKAVQEKLIK